MMNRPVSRQNEPDLRLGCIQSCKGSQQHQLILVLILPSHIDEGEVFMGFAVKPLRIDPIVHQINGRIAGVQKIPQRTLVSLGYRRNANGAPAKSPAKKGKQLARKRFFRLCMRRDQQRPTSEQRPGNRIRHSAQMDMHNIRPAPVDRRKDPPCFFGGNGAAFIEINRLQQLLHRRLQRRVGSALIADDRDVNLAGIQLPEGFADDPLTAADGKAADKYRYSDLFHGSSLHCPALLLRGSPLPQHHFQK